MYHLDERKEVNSHLASADAACQWKCKDHSRRASEAVHNNTPCLHNRHLFLIVIQINLPHSIAIIFFSTASFITISSVI